jgi:two-component system, NarL family, nitrate/nitrite response regulator NarL
MKVIKVVLVGMNNLFLQGLRHLLDPAQFTIAGEAGDLAGWSALVGDGLVPDPAPDLLLTDLNGCSEDDLEHLQRIRARLEDIRIVVLADELCLTNMARLLRAGVDGYLLKDLSARALSLSLLLVMNGEKALPSTLASVLADDPRTEAANGASIRAQKHLTEREEQILRCLLNAYSNKHIARALNISEGTVKVHLKSLMKKIAAGNRTQAALWARNNGIAHRELLAGRP